MAKPPRQARSATEGTVTLSVRLTTEQRTVVERAASLLGWTPTNLLRMAVLERAAHVVNTREVTSLNFAELAWRMAEQLVGPHRYYLLGEHNEWREMDLFGDGLYAGQDPQLKIEPEPLQPDRVDELFAAARFGGGEFLNLFIEACRARVSRSKGALTSPIDPSVL